MSGQSRSDFTSKHLMKFAGQDRVRWCASCGTQRGTQRGKFVEHTKPNGAHCPNSGKRIDEVEEAGHNQQTKIGA